MSHTPTVMVTSDDRPRLPGLWYALFSAKYALRPKGQLLKLKHCVFCVTFLLRLKKQLNIEHVMQHSKSICQDSDRRY